MAGAPIRTTLYGTGNVRLHAPLCYRRAVTTASLEPRFSQDWPPSCPPSEAAPTAGRYYRIVKTSPAAPADFRSHRELGKLPSAPPCLRAGLSTFRTHEDAEAMALLLPVLGGHVAAGTLDGTYGRSMLTRGQQPTHTTLWPHEGIDRAAPFDTVTTVRRPS
jgi:hypothetical protein